MWVSLVIDSGYLVSNDRLDTQSYRDKLAKMLNLQDLQEAPDMAQRYHRRARTGLKPQCQHQPMHYRHHPLTL